MGKSTISDEKLAGKISDEDKTSITAKIEETISWLESNGNAEKEEYEAKQKEIEAIVNPILQNLSGGAGGMPDMSGAGFPGGTPQAPTPDVGGDDGPKIE